jgi:hypothetical protein
MGAMSVLADDSAETATTTASLVSAQSLFLPVLANGNDASDVALAVSPPLPTSVPSEPSGPGSAGDVVIEPGDIPANAPPLIPPPDPNAPDGDDAEVVAPTPEPTLEPTTAPDVQSTLESEQAPMQEVTPTLEVQSPAEAQPTPTANP